MRITRGTKVCSIMDVMEDQEHGPYDFTVNGKCSGCGGCCSNYLPMTENEVRTIKRYVKKFNIKPQKHLGVPMANPTVIDLTCPFMDDTKRNDKCTIYEVRPAICRYFVCNDPHESLRHEEMYQEERKNINVRRTFFGE